MGTGSLGVDQMKLVIGGAYQGKREFLMKKWDISEGEIADMEDFRDDESGRMSAAADPGIRAVVHYQVLVREQTERGLDPAGSLRQLAALNPGIILCADEIGMGIVPMDRKERNFREACGRTLCLAAQMSDEVWRVICGIGERIK